LQLGGVGDRVVQWLAQQGLTAAALAAAGSTKLLPAGREEGAVALAGSACAT